ASAICRSKATCPPERLRTPPEVPLVDRDCLRARRRAPGPQCGTLLTPAMPSAPASSKRPAIVTRLYGGVKAEARREERRQRLLAAGLEVFGRHGYHHTTVRNIC